MSVCNICGKSFVPYFELSNSREIIIDGISFFICPDCNAKFHNTKELTAMLLQGSQNLQDNSPHSRA